MNWLYGILAALLLGFGGGFYFGGLRSGESCAKTELKTETGAASIAQTQVQQEAKQLQTDTQSEAQYVQDATHPPPLVINHPVFLHEPTVCHNVQGSSTTPSGTTEPAPGGSNDEGTGGDLRPELKAYAAHIETIVAGCREGARDWPTQ